MSILSAYCTKAGAYLMYIQCKLCCQFAKDFFMRKKKYIRTDVGTWAGY